MSNVGPLGHFMGIEVLQSTKGYLSQSKYIQELIARSGLTDDCTAATPMDIHLQLCPDDGSPLQDPSRYRYIVGSLVYLTITRPDIAHDVHILSQLVSAPTSDHYGHLLRVLRYLRGTTSRGLIVIFLFGFMPTLMPLGQVIALIAALLQVIVFSLVPLLLHGNQRSKLLYQDLVQKQNFELLLPLLSRLYGYDGYWLILVSLVILLHLFCVIALEPFKLQMIL
jgi:hypothetical protein